MIIKKLNKDEHPPFELLLSADPSLEAVEKYVERGRALLLNKAARLLACMCCCPQGLIL